jgi:hypothetical protein
MVLVDFVLQIVQNHWDKNISSAVVSSTLDIYRQILYLFIILFVYFIFMFYYFADYLFPVSCGCPRQYHNVWRFDMCRYSIIWYKYTLKNTEGAIKTGQSRETGKKHWIHKTKKNKTKTQHIMYRTPLYANKHK